MERGLVLLPQSITFMGYRLYLSVLVQMKQRERAGLCENVANRSFDIRKDCMKIESAILFTMQSVAIVVTFSAACTFGLW